MNCWEMFVRQTNPAHQRAPGKHGAHRKSAGSTHTFAARVAILCGLAALVSACVFDGASSSFLGSRTTWFSFLSGSDFRQACLNGGPDRTRLVYNADFNRQARAYDIVVQPAGSAEMEHWVDRGVTFGPGGNLLLDPIGTRASRVLLNSLEVDELESALVQSGVFEPPPQGLRLDSRRVYWLVSGCRDGEFFLTAFRAPSAAFDAVTFDEVVFGHDITGVPVRSPSLGVADTSSLTCRSGDRDPTGTGSVCFLVTVGSDGLQGL